MCKVEIDLDKLLEFGEKAIRLKVIEELADGYGALDKQLIKLVCAGSREQKGKQDKKKKTYDEGKIMALYNAKWSPEKIADELGLGWTAADALQIVNKASKA